jgi:hypothetical protein
MIAILQRIAQSESFDAQRAALGGYLGLDAPVSGAVLRRARVDERFASLLVLSRPYLDLLNRLLNAPATLRYEAEAPPITTSRAVRKAAGSLLAWARSGFETVDDDTYAARIATCEACPHLGAAPELIVYKLKLDSETDMRTCKRCGCVARRKARLATESCPDLRWAKKEASGE